MSTPSPRATPVVVQEDDRIAQALDLERRATALRAQANALFSAADQLRKQAAEDPLRGPGLWASRFTDSSESDSAD